MGRTFLICDGVPVDPPVLEREVRRVCAGLVQHGVVEGDVVAAMWRNSVGHVALVLACRLAGVYLVEINWHFKAAEASHLLRDSAARMLFIESDLIAQVADGLPAALTLVVAPASQPAAAVLARTAPETPLKLVSKPASHCSLDSAPDSAVDRALDWSEFGVGVAPMPQRSGLSHATIAYTSGTTGQPKGVRRLPRASDAGHGLSADQQALNRTLFGVGADSVVLLPAPIYHSAPMSYLVHACLVGATVLLESRFDAARILALIERHRVSHAYLVPTMYQRLLSLDRSERERFDLSSVRHVTSTGSPCPAHLKRSMIDWWGPVITEAYASSETGYITFIESADWLAHPGSAGRAVGKAKIRILDDDGQAVSPGAIGLIYARQPATPDFTYVNNAPARMALERDGLFTLGDMGYLDADGYLTICDRRTDMVISGGANIYPAEIEAVLQTMPGVADCAVFGIPDAEFGEVLAAAIQRHPGVAAVGIEADENIDADAVRVYLRERIAHFKVPRQVTFHDALPREDTGKIFKRMLREPYWRGQKRTI